MCLSTEFLELLKQRQLQQKFAKLLTRRVVMFQYAFQYVIFSTCDACLRVLHGYISCSSTFNVPSLPAYHAYLDVIIPYVPCAHYNSQTIRDTILAMKVFAIQFATHFYAKKLLVFTVLSNYNNRYNGCLKYKMLNFFLK